MQNPSEGTSRSVAEEASGSLGYLPGVGGLGPGFEGGGVVSPTVPPIVDEGSLAYEPPPISRNKALLFSSGNFGSGVYFAWSGYIISAVLDSLHVDVIFNNLLSSTRSVEGAIIQPIIGNWSDRTWRPYLGRRRAFIVGFIPISATFIILAGLSMLLGGFAHSIGLDSYIATLVMLVVSIFLYTMTFNIMYDPYNALLADITPERQRGRVNGVFQGLGALGQVFILLTAFVFSLVGIPAFLPTACITAALLVILFIPTVVGIREPRVLPGLHERKRYTFQDYWRALRADRQVQLYFANQALLWFGINAINPTLVYYAKHVLNFSDSQKFGLVLVLLLFTGLFVWPFGLLGDRLGLKRAYLIGMMLMAGAAIIGSFPRDQLTLYVVVAIGGIGNAAQTASSYPLLTQLVLPEHMGLYTGLNSTVTSIFSPAGALIAGALIDIFGYQIFFPFCAATFLASLIPLAILRIEEGMLAKARAEQAAARAA